MREDIIISDVDLNILDFLKEPRYVKDIKNNFSLGDSSYKIHFDRLNRLNIFSIKPLGNLKILKLNIKGLKLLKLLKFYIN